MWVIMVVLQLMLPRDSLKSIVSLLSLQSGFNIVISKGHGRLSNGKFECVKKTQKEKIDICLNCRRFLRNDSSMSLSSFDR